MDEPIRALTGWEWIDSLLRACHKLNEGVPDHQEWIEQARERLSKFDSMDRRRWLAEHTASNATASAFRLKAELEMVGPILDACDGLLAFIRERFPKDFEAGGDGYLCPHHRAIDAALRAYRAKKEGK